MSEVQGQSTQQLRLKQVHIEAELHLQLKIAAAEEGTSMTKVVERQVREYLKTRKHAAA